MRSGMLLLVLLVVAALVAGCGSTATYKPNTIQGPTYHYSFTGEGGQGTIEIWINQDSNGVLRIGGLPKGLLEEGQK